MSSRLENEIKHGKKLIADGAEDVWNWNSPSGRVRATKRAKLILKFAGLNPQDEVLEIGCGTGLFTEKIFNASNAKITAIDISDELLNNAKARLPQVTFMNADAMNLPFEENTFDVVFGSSVLHHLELGSAYKEIYRVLKPGGRMVFAEPNMLNPQIFLQKNIPFLKRMLGDSPDETAIVRWKEAKNLRKVGFQNIQIFPYDFLHPITPKILIPFVNKLSSILEQIPLIREISGSVIMFAEK